MTRTFPKGGIYADSDAHANSKNWVPPECHVDVVDGNLANKRKPSPDRNITLNLPFFSFCPTYHRTSHVAGSTRKTRWRFHQLHHTSSNCWNERILLQSDETIAIPLTAVDVTQIQQNMLHPWRLLPSFRLAIQFNTDLGDCVAFKS